MRWTTQKKKKRQTNQCLQHAWGHTEMGVGKEAASLGQRHIRLVKLNGAIKGLTTKAIYLIRKQILFSAYWATFILNAGELLPRVISPGDTSDRHQIHSKKHIYFLVPQVVHDINLEGLVLSMRCLMLAFIPMDRWLKSHRVPRVHNEVYFHL